MKIITKTFAVTALLFMSLSVNAAVIAINYEVTDAGTFWGDGLFTGVDSNADNMLTFDELTSFSGSNNVENEFIGLSNLIDMGDYDIANNIWINNAESWPGLWPDSAWFTWENGGNVSSVNGHWNYLPTGGWGPGGPTAGVTTSPVPAPPAVWLFISGLIFLIGVMRRRASKLAVISA